MLPNHPEVRAPGIPAKHTRSIGKRNHSPAIPSPFLWDGLLAAGDPTAALDLLERIAAGQNWRQAPARPATTGSSWDAAQGPDAPLPQHLSEWVDQSAIHPALAAANLQSLAGREVLEALTGDRLEHLGGHASQYTTGAVARLLRPLEPVAAAGGWWCSGLDPAADWKQPMAWGCLRPDAPRWDQERDRPRKYEHPIGAPARSFWLRVPAAVAQLVADRHGLELPAEVAADRDGGAGAFWRWWAQTPALPLVLVEGAKKAAALLSAGVPAVALPGIWNGTPKHPETGRPELLADLAAVPWDGRLAMVLFDHSTRKDPAEPKAAGRLARLLLRAGARQAMVGTVPGSHGKGADDHLANGGTWEQLLEALKPLAPLPVLPRLRAADIVAPAGCFLGTVAPIPPAAEARLVAFASPMGSGKTTAIADAIAPLLAAGIRVVLLTHRQSLGAALAAELGLPWGDDALPGSDLRQQGMALCIDSLCRRSALRFNPADWAGAVVVIDEAAQVLSHALFATGTAIAHRRPEVLEALSQLLAGAAQVIAADAQLSDPVLAALEAATGARALLIGSEHRPAEGRQLVNHPDRGSWRTALAQHLRARRRCWIFTTAQQAGSANAAQNLDIWARQQWPGARVLMVDCETVADPNHDAHRLAADPNGIAGAYDVVITTPAVAAGLSVTLRGHFEAVFVGSGGTIDPEAIAQAAARVRDDCPRHLYAPETSPGRFLRVGSGCFEAQQLLTHQARHGAAIAAQLAGTVDLQTGTIGPWLPLWAELAALSNRKALTYAATVRGLLEREGYRVIEAEALDIQGEVDAKTIAIRLRELAQLQQEAEDHDTISAQLLTDAQAAELLKRRRRLQPAEAAQLRRWRIAKAWGLAAAAPTFEVLEADREQRSQRGRFAWALQSLEARQLVARHDQATAQQLAPRGIAWQPDLCRELIGPKLTAADALGLPAWLRRSDWFTADDAQLQQHLQASAIAAAGGLPQALGVSAGKTGTGTLRRLLKLAGYCLEAKRSKEGGARAWRYRVVPEALPAGVTPQQLETAWAAQLSSSPRGGGPKKSPT